MGDNLISASTSSRDGETVPTGEAEATKAIVDRLVAQVRADARSGPARRDAHPKGHGCVEARFQVHDGLPERLRVGLFAAAREHACYIRFSNGFPKAQPDAKPDVRGMAIKVMGVASSPSRTQDFVMINGPRFFVKTAADYLDFTTADPRWRFFVPGWNPFALRWREALNLADILRRKVSNPLDSQYWSTLPFAFGDGACKYSARPVGAPSAFTDRTSDAFLRENLRGHLVAGERTFDFMVQLRTRPYTMPIEDSTIGWRESDAPFATVARITIPPQEIGERDAIGENLSFTPWHGLHEHRPLGGINRVRRSAYETVSALRHDINGVAREEPERFVRERGTA